MPDVTKPTSPFIEVPSSLFWRHACITTLVDHVIETDETDRGAVELYVADVEASNTSDGSFWARFETLEHAIHAFRAWAGVEEELAEQ